MEKFLITGITGQVGSQFADYLLENTKYEVLGMMRWQESMENIYHLTNKINKRDQIFIEYADLNDFPSIYALLKNYKPEFITHLAAQSYPKTSFDIPIETFNTNIIGTANLLESIRKLNDNEGYNPAIHICSSSEVYGKSKAGKKLNEESVFHASSPYSISKIGTDYLGQFYGEAYSLKTFITRMGTHSGPRRSDVFFESTVAKQIALIEANLQKPIIYIGNTSSIRTYQDARDAVRAYFLLMQKCYKGELKNGDYFNIAGEEAFKLDEILKILISKSFINNIKIEVDPSRLRPIDADYQMFDNTKIKSVIDWEPKIKVEQMLEDLLEHWRQEISKGNIPLNR